jgi:teichuronic acid biosynthesis glycosyltransferase TuaC
MPLRLTPNPDFIYATTTSIQFDTTYRFERERRIVTLQRRSLRILFISPDEGGMVPLSFASHLGAALEKLGVTVRTFIIASRTNPVSLAREWFQCRDLISNFDPDIIHAQYGTVTSMFAALLSSRPLLIHFRGSDLNYDPEHSFVRNRLATLLSHISALRADRIIAVSEQLRDKLSWQKKRVEMVPNGVDLDLFRPQPQSEARNLLNWPLDEKVALINVGPTPKLKGLDLALAATAKAAETEPLLRLHVLNGYARHKDMPIYYNAADCLLMASVSEGSPTVVKEALACCLPIVSVDVGDVRERLQRVEPAFITKRDPNDMARAIVQALNGGKRSNGREYARAVSLSTEAERIKAIYEDMLTEASRK